MCVYYILLFITYTNFILKTMLSILKAYIC